MPPKFATPYVSKPASGETYSKSQNPGNGANCKFTWENKHGLTHGAVIATHWKIWIGINAGGGENPFRFGKSVGPLILPARARTQMNRNSSIRAIKGVRLPQRTGKRRRMNGNRILSAATFHIGHRERIFTGSGNTPGRTCRSVIPQITQAGRSLHPDQDWIPGAKNSISRQY